MGDKLPGTLIILTGPTGSGKGTLLKHIFKTFPEIVHPVSCTTRAPRPGEKDGEDYHFISKEAFKEKIEKGDFLEWAIFDDNYYGTPKEEALELLRDGKTIVGQQEVQGVRILKNVLPEKSLVTIFIDGGPWGELEKRAVERSFIETKSLERRKERHSDEVTFKDEATFVVSNKDGEIEKAKEEVSAIIKNVLAS